MSAMPQPRYTPEQYMEKERAAPCKSEYYSGEMFAMAGASPAHNILVAAIAAALVTRLRGRPCTTFASDLKVECGPSGLFSYPDLTVLCGEPSYHDNHQDMILNPTVLVEVLSATTEAYDRGAKFAQYRRLTSLQEYVLVSQSEARIEVFTRETDGRWTLFESVGIDADCPLNSLGIVLPLIEVYDRIEFPPSPNTLPSA